MIQPTECDESTETSQCVDVFIAFCQLNHRNVFLFLYGKILFNKITIQKQSCIFIPFSCFWRAVFYASPYYAGIGVCETQKGLPEYETA